MTLGREDIAVILNMYPNIRKTYTLFVPTKVRPLYLVAREPIWEGLRAHHDVEASILCAIVYVSDE